jgi:hypothetical protein
MSDLRKRSRFGLKEARQSADMSETAGVIPFEA